MYSISDPRANIFRVYRKLAVEKDGWRTMIFIAVSKRLAPEVISKERRIYKGVSANVDFYSGLVYGMLASPTELYTPIFAIARIAGWSAHRMEELIQYG